jgi:hypothetical protein
MPSGRIAVLNAVMPKDSAGVADKYIRTQACAAVVNRRRGCQAVIGSDPVRGNSPAAVHETAQGHVGFAVAR